MGRGAGPVPTSCLSCLRATLAGQKVPFLKESHTCGGGYTPEGAGCLEFRSQDVPSTPVTSQTSELWTLLWSAVPQCSLVAPR